MKPPPLLDKIERQRRRLARERADEWRGASIADHAEALLDLLRLTDRLYAGRPFPPPEPRSEEAVTTWRAIVRQGYA